MSDEIQFDVADRPRRHETVGEYINRQQLAAFLAFARSVRVARQSLAGRLGKSFDGARDLYKTLGYPLELAFEDYEARYERDGMAGRIVDFPAEETWRDEPEVRDGEDKDALDDTPFVAAWNDLAKRLRVYHYCERVDKLSGIGRFGVLLIGVAGAGDLSTEVTRVSGPDAILYLRPFSEGSVEIVEYERDPENPRFGMPSLYRIRLVDLEGGTSGTENGGNPLDNQMTVHWSRIIHVAENLGENEIFGRPRLKRAYNRLEDGEKVIGGSAEATWKLMRKGFLLDADPEAEISKEEEDKLIAQIEEYEHGLRRFMTTQGMDVKDLGSEVVDPTGIWNAITSYIAATTGIPQRILLGSERGELASTQDGANWAGRIASRQEHFAEPVILRPLIDRLIRWGALPRPSRGQYSIIWKPLFALTDQERADIARTWAEAIQKLAIAYGQPPVLASEWRRHFTPWPGAPEDALIDDEQATREALDQIALKEAPVEPEPPSNEEAPAQAEIAAMVRAASRIIARGGI